MACPGVKNHQTPQNELDLVELTLTLPVAVGIYFCMHCARAYHMCACISLGISS